jgi:integrase
VVRDTKFGKHRLVPLHPSAMRALTRYRQFRRERLPRLASPALLLSPVGERGCCTATSVLSSPAWPTGAGLPVGRRPAPRRRRSTCARVEAACATGQGGLWPGAPRRDGADPAAAVEYPVGHGL